MAGNIGGGGQDGDPGMFAEFFGEALDFLLPEGIDDVVDEAVTDQFAQKANREVYSLFQNASLNAGQQVVADDVVSAMQDAIDSDFPEADVVAAAEDVLPDGFEALSDLIDEAAAIVDGYQEEALAFSGESAEE